MKLLIFHNTLFAQYKSIFFEKIFNELSINDKNELLVIQTSLSEQYRINHYDKSELFKSIKYPYILITEKPLETVSQLRILYNWIYYIFTFKPNIVNITGYNSWTIFIVLRLCKFLKIRTIITTESVQTNNQNKNIIKKFIVETLKKLIIFQCDYFYTFGINSNYHLFSYNVPKNKILFWGNTFDKYLINKNTYNKNISDYHESEKINFLYIGRYSPEKNLINSIKILSKVNQSIKINFQLFGDGPLEPELKNFCTKNNYDFVKINKAIKWNEIQAIYKQFNYFILLSDFEPWGIVANEAQHFGINVICSSNCGCANDLIINNYNGLVIDKNHLNESHDLIINYIKKNNYSEKFILNNNEIFDEKYAIKSFIKKLYEINESK